MMFIPLRGADTWGTGLRLKDEPSNEGGPEDEPEKYAGENGSFGVDGGVEIR